MSNNNIEIGNETTKTLKLIEELNINNLCNFLTAKGWNEFSQARKEIRVFQKSFGDSFLQLNIPLDKSLKDYSYAMRKCVLELANSLDETEDSILLQIAEMRGA